MEKIHNKNNPQGEKNNKRIMPVGKELEDKHFPIGIWGYLQAVSKCNHLDDFRYVDKKALTYTKICDYLASLSKGKNDDDYHEKNISRPTVAKGLKYLKENNYILEEVEAKNVIADATGTYYKIKNQDVFEYFLLFESDFISALFATLPQEAIKVYLVYYSFNVANGEGICYLKQEDILKRIGLSASTGNFEKLRHINKLLRGAGLIYQQYKVQKNTNGAVVKKNIITKTPLRFKTTLYNKAKSNAIEPRKPKQEIIIEYIDIED